MIVPQTLDRDSHGRHGRCAANVVKRLTPRVIHLVGPLLILLVLAYGALLRLDAISAKFDAVTLPRWLHRLQLTRTGDSMLRPARMRWSPAPRFPHRDGPPSQYRSDPYTYLQHAREMRTFYAASRREPLFPFATKMWLRWLHDNDVAVSFASGAFSVLAIALIVFLGAEVFSLAVGLAAGLLWATEYEVISTGTEGWRDEAFTCAVLLTALAMLRLIRRPSIRYAAMLGLASGAACLVRITSVSFVLSGFAYLCFAIDVPWRRRARLIAVAAGVAALAVAPFLVNCWRVYGNPLHTIDVHVDVYRAAESNDTAAPADAGEKHYSVRSYVSGHLRARPVATIDTLVLGLTSYPFANKWTGFEVWHPLLGRGLALAAIAGLCLLMATPAGRLLLSLLLSSLIPYAWTWRLIADWRFTEHAYPFFLIAACSPAWLIVGAIISRGKIFRNHRAVRRALAWSAIAAATGAATWLVFTRVTPRLVFAERVRAGEAATILAADRDASFFTTDWSRVTAGLVPTRVADGARATMLVPLPDAMDYEALLRVDPSTEPMRPGVSPGTIRLLLNGRLIAACDPDSSPQRIGVCRMLFPAAAVRPGRNRLTLVTDQPSGFRVWYLRVTKRAP